ncbi:MAG TPA: 1,4-dihydroxy-2-naphthoate polyprenyltransferase, partial [Acidimicrobiaceae bacterium]|nr:1,4-dihydroxy-2-naphthoate polyprenyltransferase [Acidimicrobiaceae bacterium]
LALAAAVAWWLVAVGAACIAAAWYYTGGRRPYGYRGWGEVSVFVFFGLVANNLRDRPGDAESGKRTLAVLMGDRGTRVLYVALTAALFVSLPYLALVRPWALLALAALPLAVMPVRAVLLGRSGRDLIPVLAGTARLQLGFGVALTVGLALGA